MDADAVGLVFRETIGFVVVGKSGRKVARLPNVDYVVAVGISILIAPGDRVDRANIVKGLIQAPAVESIFVPRFSLECDRAHFSHGPSPDDAESITQLSSKQGTLRREFVCRFATLHKDILYNPAIIIREVNRTDRGV